MSEYSAQTTLGTFDSPFRFNGKELDKETGYSYYGARYYQSKLSMWLSVDPKAHWYPAQSPYNFSLNNPVNLEDPNGMWVVGGGFLNNLFLSDEAVVEKMAHKYAKENGSEAIPVEGGWRVSDPTSTVEYNGNAGSLEVGFKDFIVSKLSLGVAGSVDVKASLAFLGSGLNLSAGIGRDSDGQLFWHYGYGPSVGIDYSVGLFGTAYIPYKKTDRLRFGNLSGEGRSNAVSVFGFIDAESGGDAKGRYPSDWSSIYRNPVRNVYYTESLGRSAGLPFSYTHNFTTTRTGKLW
jgi:RHS repeat-associated protein